MMVIAPALLKCISALEVLIALHYTVPRLRSKEATWMIFCSTVKSGDKSLTSPRSSNRVLLAHTSLSQSQVARKTTMR